MPLSIGIVVATRFYCIKHADNIAIKIESQEH